MSGFNIYFFPSSLFYFYHDPESKSVTDTQTDRQTDRQIDRQTAVYNVYRVAPQLKKVHTLNVDIFFQPKFFFLFKKDFLFGKNFLA